MWSAPSPLATSAWITAHSETMLSGDFDGSGIKTPVLKLAKLTPYRLIKAHAYSRAGEYNGRDLEVFA